MWHSWSIRFRVKVRLIMSELVPAVSACLKRVPGVLPEWMKEIFAGREKIEGIEAIENLIVIDQTPIGRSSRSTPATYLAYLMRFVQFLLRCQKV